ncbi:hypothetical protein [Saccharibacillus brassicae]|uniref:hypothetical protein n=1 Tax=Saccharibacillus brassicae TaxID=2583377 RepID=UPI0014793674|nr:hypothetical protein [Saccharibacillus brassicae]
MKKHLLKLIPVFVLSVAVSGTFANAPAGNDAQAASTVQKPGKIITLHGPGIGEW